MRCLPVMTSDELFLAMREVEGVVAPYIPVPLTTVASMSQQPLSYPNETFQSSDT
jgi:hypothetical protein